MKVHQPPIYTGSSLSLVACSGQCFLRASFDFTNQNEPNQPITVFVVSRGVVKSAQVLSNQLTLQNIWQTKLMEDLLISKQTFVKMSTKDQKNNSAFLVTQRVEQLLYGTKTNFIENL